MFSSTHTAVIAISQWQAGITYLPCAENGNIDVTSYSHTMQRYLGAIYALAALTLQQPPVF